MHSEKKTSHNWLAMRIANRAFLRYKDNLNGIVADLGCGRSPFKSEILRTARRYIGVDWKASMHSQETVDVFSNLNERIDLPDASVDAAIAMHVLEHLCEPERFLQEAWRILKPGGFLLIAVPFNWHLHEQPHDFYRYTPYCLDYLLRKHGFTSVEVTSEGGFFTTITLKFNYQVRRVFSGSMSFLPAPLFLADQFVANWLDNKWPTPGECIAVTATARKTS